MLYREWARFRTSRTGCMVSEEELKRIIEYIPNPGFASLYSFSKEDAQIIIDRGSSRDFHQFTPISDELLIDLDDGGASLPALEEQIKGLKYEVYFSGSKGAHVILHHEPIADNNLPYSHKKVVEGYGVDADMCLYHPSRLISLPGRVHHKTGKKKELIKRVDGELIVIPMQKKPEINFDFSGLDGDATHGLSLLLRLKTNPPKVGTRHIRLWQTATDLLKAGFDINSISQFFLVINQDWPEPQSESEVLSVVEQAANRLGK